MWTASLDSDNVLGLSYESLDYSSCKESDGPELDSQSHTFRTKVFKRPRPCNVCHQPIYNQGSCCRVCKFICHKACEHKHGYETPTKQPTKKPQMPLTTQPRSSSKAARRSGGDAMDLSYVTERIIALWVPGDVGPAAYRQGQQQAAQMLQTKHKNNYMVFNLSEPRRAARNQHKERVRELGWPPDLAPPLERLCTVCKDIDSWLSGDVHRIAVIHARGSKERIGVVIAAYMHYSSICGSAEQALDRFAMDRFLNDKIGDVEQPSHKRYVEYFSGLLSGSIRINSAPLYLTHVTVLGAPSFESAENDASGGCRAFLKVYEGLVPVYTSGIHGVAAGTRQFTVNVAGERQQRGLKLRGDILVKCYHRYTAPIPAPDSPTRSTTPMSGASSTFERPQRELIFACQFHTCAVSDYTLSFTRQELDAACTDLRFPLDGAVELHFSPTPEVRLPSPAPTPAVTVDHSDDPVTRWDSYENLSLMESPLDGDTDTEDTVDGEDADLNHTYGPLDGSIYATISKKQQQQQQQQQQQEAADRASVARETSSAVVPVIGSPHTVSMDSGISSAGNGLAVHPNKNSNNNTSNESASPNCNGHRSPPISPADHHRALDELLNDMLLTVENIPDLPPTPSSTPYGHHHHYSTTSSLASRQKDGLQTSSSQFYPRDSGDVSGSSGGVPRSASVGSYPGARAPRKAHNGYVSAPTDTASASNGAGVFSDLDVNFIDAEVDPDNIPYHARQDSRPFTYGPVPASSTPQHQPKNGTMMKQMPLGLASPSLVRKASFNKGDDGSRGSPHFNGSSNAMPTSTPLYKTPPVIDTRPTLRKSQTSPLTSPPLDFIDAEVLSSPTSDYLNGSSSTSPRSPEFHDGSIIGVTNGNNLTWLQRQQQKLRERREGQIRVDRYPSERRLITELRTIQQHSYRRELRPSASHRDGYTSDTTHFADDDDEDFTTPLHINISHSPTAALKPNNVGSAPASPMLPNRTGSSGSRRNYSTIGSHTAGSYISGSSGTSPLGRQRSENSFDRERPFVAVKRAHEQNRKFNESSSPAEHPLGHANNRVNDVTDSAGLLTTMVEEMQQQHEQGNATMLRGGVGSSATNHHHQDALASLIASLAATSSTNSSASPAWQPSQLRDESFSSWRTTSTSDDPGSPARSSSPRPQTPAFPVHPRTPYVNNGSTPQFESPAAAGLPPKSPTTQRRSLSTSSSFKFLRKWPSNSSEFSKDLSPSPLSEHVLSQSLNGVRAGAQSANSFNELQQSPKSPTSTHNGSSSPTVYFGQSRRSSMHSNSEPPQEVSPVHVKFVRDTSRFWYKPTITREEAISLLRDQQPGTFVVRDSNSFPGAFGLALKVSTPPPTVQGKIADPGNELVRHFLIEPTSRGVKLKGCSNEPVFSSLSALVYQHSLIPMALPCRLVLPEGDSSRLVDSPGAVSTAQMLLAQGAACNVLYLFTTEMESLTGPQAIKKAVQAMFMTRPLPYATVVHFKVSGQGITLTDNKRQLFFRRHYPTNTISHCGLDPDDHRWSQKSEETGLPISSNRCFGFVARKPASKQASNQCHIFAELEPEQPASAIVNFVCKVMMSTGTIKANIV